MEVGKELKLSEGELEALKAAALLHDIGKIAVPDHILAKPGKLTPAEFQKMKVHPVVGAEILERVRFPFQVAPIVRCHHEKWDGSGYLAGLKGEEIPIGARILSAVDCLDALASDRHYRRALPLDEARLAKVVAFDSVALCVPRRGSLSAIFAAGSHREALASLTISIGKGVSGWAAGANRPILNGNPAVELCYAAAPCRSGALGSVLALPLAGAMGPVGVLTLYGAAENAFRAEDLMMLAGLGGHLASYLEKNSGEAGTATGLSIVPQLAPAPEVLRLVH